MRQLFLLQNPLDLAAAEVLALTNKSHEQYDNFLIVNTAKNIAPRLSYTKQVYKILFDCHKYDLLPKANRFKWKYKTFSISHPSKHIRNELVAILKKKSKLKLTKPEAKLKCFYINNKICVTQLIHENKEKFEKRKPHKLIAPHPASCDPKLARAMVNLTGINKGKILDPFCGAGGMLIEASLMNLKPTGYDIDDKMLKRAKTNLKHLKCKADLKLKDALTLPATNYIVSDLPYGKGTKAVNLKELYESFFKVLKKKLKKTAVIGIPDFVEINPKLKIKHEFIIYIHKSLSKRIIVFSS